MTPDKALVAMSGGVDSAVSLLLSTRRYGCEAVAGLTLALAEPGTPGAISDGSNIRDAAAVCDAIGTEHRFLCAHEAFAASVIDYFTSEYLAGRTPNPCVVCNRTVKFGLLADYAVSNGFTRLVTGHYARLSDEGGVRWIKRAADPAKDQSYMLALLTQAELRLADFPLGELTKAEVRAMAEENGLPVAHRQDSQDVCFIPDGDYAAFVCRRTGFVPQPGDYVNENGDVLGQHRGALHYTIGQRRELGIALGRRIYVTAIDAAQNRVTLGDEVGLFRRTVRLSGLHCPSDPTALDGEFRCEAKIRYAHRAAAASFRRTGDDEGELTFDEGQRAPTPGQFAVLYDGDTVLGAGVIESAR